MLTKRKRSIFHTVNPLLLIVLALIVAAGCSNMEEQPKLDEPYQSSQTFGRAARNILPEAVPVGFERADEHLYSGTVEGELADTLPFELTADVLAQGQKRYNEFCAACHGLDGSGEGIIALEGFPQPASYHTDDLRSAPVGYIFRVITEGKGAMFNIKVEAEHAAQQIREYLRDWQPAPAVTA